jgi:hypothetical protein
MKYPKLAINLLKTCADLQQQPCLKSRPHIFGIQFFLALQTIIPALTCRRRVDTPSHSGCF